MSFDRTAITLTTLEPCPREYMSHGQIQPLHSITIHLLPSDPGPVSRGPLQSLQTRTANHTVPQIQKPEDLTTVTDAVVPSQGRDNPSRLPACALCPCSEIEQMLDEGFRFQLHEKGSAEHRSKSGGGQQRRRRQRLPQQPPASMWRACAMHRKS